MVTLVLIASLVLQFVAAYFALRLIKLTGRSLAWSFITAAITLMALHRGVSLSHILIDGEIKLPALSAEWITLAISALMAFGIWRITPIFIALRSNSERLKESEIHYRTIFENSPISIWEEDFSGVKALFDRLRQAGVSDIEKHFERHPEVVKQCSDLAIIVDVNRAALTLHGAVSKEELLAGLANIFTAESLDAFRHELACLWRGETEMSCDAMLRTLAGELRSVTVYFAVCPGYEGTLSKIFVSLIDITERKQAEAALAASERQFRSLAESSPDNIIRYDRQCRANYYNHMMAQTIPIDPELILGKTPLELGVGGPQIDAEYEGHIRRVLENGESSDMTLSVPHPGGGLRNHLVRFAAERDTAGNITGVLAIGRDVTGLKLMEEALFFVAQHGWRAGKDNFFDSLVQFLGEKLDMDYALIGRLDDNQEMVETIAFYAKGAIAQNNRYALKGTPSENVMGRHLRVYSQGVQQQFPEDTLLVDMGVESYVGIPLWDSSGLPIGLIALMGSKPLHDEAPATQVLQLVATRAAAELERERSDRILRAREHEFRTLAESLPDYIARYDREGRAVYCNPVLEKTFGIAAADWNGRRVREFYTDGSYEAYAQAVDAVLAGGENSEFEFISPDQNKKKIVYQMRMIAERDEYGEVSGVLAIARDITELKQAEQARQAHTDFLVNMDRISRAIHGTNNLEMMMSNVLDEVLDIFGCDRAFLLYPCYPAAASWSIPMERTRPEYPGAGALGVDIPMGPEVAATLELLLKHPGILKFGSGTNYPVPAEVSERFGVKSFMSTAIRPKVGNAWQFGIHQCSYERVWTPAEEQLLQEIGRRLADGLSSLLMLRDLLKSEEKYRRIFDTTSEGIWGQDENSATTFVNARMAEMLGCTHGELQGRLVTDFMFEEDIADHAQRISNRKRNISEAYERRFRRKDGRTVWTLISATPVLDDEGKYNGSFAMITDITELKQAEEALRSYSDNLEATVQQRTTELRLARDAAEAASKAKSQFLAHMSHELRTPLNAILGFSHMMRQDPGLSTAQYQNLDIINQSGEHLLKLINDVLEIAKIEAGKLQLENTTLDLHGLVREVSDMMRLRAQQKGLQMLLDLSSECPRYIKGDEARLRQILVNLIGNAVKFTRHGSVTIRLGVRDDDRHHLLLEVEDTGPGIRIEDRQRLFKPFVQMPEGARYGGTGLGLSIVKQFVQLMGGGITLESTPGEGSLFRVELPLEMADEVETARLGEAIQGEVTGLAPGQPTYRILIAEDQLDNQLLLATLMTDIGLEVKIAKNGEECVQIFTQWQPDLIWMDRRMPLMDGDEATRRIRQLAGGDKVKIVAVTASAFKEEQLELRSAGMDDYVRKPFRISEIYDSLARELGVKYTYREMASVESVAPVSLTPQKLAAIAVDLRNELQDALETLDRERIHAAIDRIGAVDTELGRILSHLGDEFDYPAILAALEAVTGDAGQSPALGKESK